jgi:hypothetical protein
MNAGMLPDMLIELGVEGFPEKSFLQELSTTSDARMAKLLWRSLLMRVFMVFIFGFYK